MEPSPALRSITADQGSAKQSVSQFLQSPAVVTFPSSCDEGVFSGSTEKERFSLHTITVFKLNQSSHN